MKSTGLNEGVLEHDPQRLGSRKEENEAQEVEKEDQHKKHNNVQLEMVDEQVEVEWPPRKGKMKVELSLLAERG